MIEKQIDLIENILAPWHDQIGADWPAYINHVYRVYHFCLLQQPCDQNERETLIIAACFHDLGIWANKTFDYLQASIVLAGEYLDSTNRPHRKDHIARIIDGHHKITRFKSPTDSLEEIFRRADWLDVTKGLRRFRVSRSDIRQIMRAFPNAGFHRRLLQLTWAEFRKHPFNPLPMMRW